MITVITRPSFVPAVAHIPLQFVSMKTLLPVRAARASLPPPPPTLCPCALVVLVPFCEIFIQDAPLCALLFPLSTRGRHTSTSGVCTCSNLQIQTNCAELISRVLINTSCNLKNRLPFSIGFNSDYFNRQLQATLNAFKSLLYNRITELH